MKIKSSSELAQMTERQRDEHFKRLSLAGKRKASKPITNADKIRSK